MNWQSVLLVGGILTALAIATLRSERRVRRWLIWIVPVPTLVLLYRWAAYRGAWAELLAAAGVGLAALLAWWLAVGRRLPPPRGSTIRVITKDGEVR